MGAIVQKYKYREMIMALAPPVSLWRSEDRRVRPIPAWGNAPGGLSTHFGGLKARSIATANNGSGFQPSDSRRFETWGFAPDSLLKCKHFSLKSVKYGIGFHLRRGVALCREELCSVIGGSGLEHAEDGVQQFSGDGHECLEFGFVAGLELLVEGFQVRIEVGGA